MILHDIGIVLEAYIVVLLVRAVFSWFPVRPGGPLAGVNTVLWRVTEPVLAPVRRLIPPLRAGGTGFDVSFLIVVVALEIVASALLSR